MNLGTLYLLPNRFSTSQKKEDIFYPNLEKIVDSLDGLIAESPNGARLFLTSFSKEMLSRIEVAPIHKNMTRQEVYALLKPLKEGKNLGFISDCGLPCIADPGQFLVLCAHELKLPVMACPGASAILAALMLSGLGGNRFAFHGYFPKDMDRNWAEALVKRATSEDSAQIFIETPYRNESSIAKLMEILPQDAMLCVAFQIFLPDQQVIVQKVSKWKPMGDLKKKMAIFVIHSPKPKR